MKVRLQIMNKKSGFTLVELLTAIAVYSILLVIFGMVVVGFSRVTKAVNNSDGYDQAALIENYIIDLWKTNQINASFTNDALLTFYEGQEQERNLIFENGFLFYGSENSMNKLFGHEQITQINRKVFDNLVIFEVLINENTKTIVLFNTRG